MGILQKAKFFIQIDQSTIHSSHTFLVYVIFTHKNDIMEEMIFIKILFKTNNGKVYFMK